VAITFEIELPAGADQPEFARADLTFYGLDHSGPSYEVRIFFDHPEPALTHRSARTPGSPANFQYSVTAAASGTKDTARSGRPSAPSTSASPTRWCRLSGSSPSPTPSAISSSVTRVRSPSPLSPSSAHRRWPPRSSPPMCWSSTKSPCTPSNNATGQLAGAHAARRCARRAAGHPRGDASDHLDTGLPKSIHRHPRVQPRIPSASRADRRQCAPRPIRVLITQRESRSCHGVRQVDRDADESTR
jgi:hypothetical protein